tara:strand:+ start:1087 stop:1491 length:405 start_codon:yes stop_codon:yes gene_type:complete
MNTQLLCTFTPKKSVNTTTDLIIDTYDIIFNKIFILKDMDNSRELMCTYNIEAKENPTILENTISLHRKKQTNTLYTINALNELIKIVNNGVLDTSYQVEWDNYRNTMLVTNDEGLRKINTSIHDIIHIKIKRK